MANPSALNAESPNAESPNAAAPNAAAPNAAAPNAAAPNGRFAARATGFADCGAFRPRRRRWFRGIGISIIKRGRAPRIFIKRPSRRVWTIPMCELIWEARCVSAGSRKKRWNNIASRKNKIRNTNTVCSIRGGVYAFDLKQPDKGIALWREYLKRFPKGQNAAQTRELIARVQKSADAAKNPRLKPRPKFSRFALCPIFCTFTTYRRLFFKRICSEELLVCAGMAWRTCWVWWPAFLGVSRGRAARTFAELRFRRAAAK